MDDILKKITEHGEYDYEYNVLSRLTKAISPVLPDENYIYDLLGNRLSNGGSYDANNALKSYDGASFEYLNDNLVRKTAGSEVTDYDYNVSA